jgi:hypothetical protein
VHGLGRHPPGVVAVQDDHEADTLGLQRPMSLSESPIGTVTMTSTGSGRKGPHTMVLGGMLDEVMVVFSPVVCQPIRALPLFWERPRAFALDSILTSVFWPSFWAGIGKRRDCRCSLVSQNLPLSNRVDGTIDRKIYSTSPSGPITRPLFSTR